jgi:hypothetical protein
MMARLRPSRDLTLLLWSAPNVFVAGERGTAPFATGSVRRGLRATARAAVADGS